MQNKESICKVMLIECMGFYHVFSTLEKDAHHIEGIADVNDLFDIELYKTPMVVNGAFAAEIALKFLLYSKDISYGTKGGKGHQLDYLFDQLDSEDSSFIMQKLKNEYPGREGENIRGAISLFAENFYKWRYIYEAHLAWCDDIFRSFVHIVCDFAIDNNTIQNLCWGGD